MFKQTFKEIIKYGTNKNAAQKCQKLQLFIQTVTFLKAIRKMWQHALQQLSCNISHTCTNTHTTIRVHTYEYIYCVALSNVYTNKWHKWTASAMHSSSSLSPSTFIITTLQRWCSSWTSCKLLPEHQRTCDVSPKLSKWRKKHDIEGDLLSFKIEATTTFNSIALSPSPKLQQNQFSEQMYVISD